MSSTCLGCVPLRLGVTAIAMFQIMYGTTRLYFAARVDDDQRGFSYYMNFTGHCMSLVAAGFIALGLLLDKKNFLLPWLGLTFMTPAVFISSLVINLLFLNFTAVIWLLAQDGLPAIFILFLIQTVYSLFLEMGDRERQMEAEAAAMEVVGDTLYGTTNAVFSLTGESPSIAGSPASGRHSEPPPAYDSLVLLHKNHVSNVSNV